MKIKEFGSLICLTCSALLYVCLVNEEIPYLSSPSWHYVIATTMWLGMGLAWKTKSRSLTVVGFGGNAFLFCSIYLIPLLWGKGLPNTM